MAFRGPRETVIYIPGRGVNRPNLGPILWFGLGGSFSFKLNNKLKIRISPSTKKEFHKKVVIPDPFDSAG